MSLCLSTVTFTSVSQFFSSLLLWDKMARGGCSWVSQVSWALVLSQRARFWLASFLWGQALLETEYSGVLTISMAGYPWSLWLSTLSSNWTSFNFSISVQVFLLLHWFPSSFKLLLRALTPCVCLPVSSSHYGSKKACWSFSLFSFL